MLVLVPCLGLAQSLPVAPAARAPGADFFTKGAPHVFDVRLSKESLEALRQTPREYVAATVRTGGLTFTNVGIHLKGVATFRPVDDQPSLTLNFSKFDRRQRFHGLRKIHLNNGKEDPTFMCEALSAEMFARAGLPVARVVLARLRLNGLDLGPYVAIEGFSPEFLGRYFHDTSGNLYDSGFRKDVTEPLERLLGKSPENCEDLQQLATAARTPNFRERWTRLAQCLDTNNFSKYLAMQTLSANWDGYAFYKNNYRIYHDPESDRLHFIPHGMDQTFARPAFALMPARWEGFAARAFVETPEGRALYQQQLARLFNDTYDTAAMVRRVDELAAALRPIIAEQGQAASRDHDRQVSALRWRIKERGEFLAQQFSTTNWMSLPRNKLTPGRTFRFPLRDPENE